MRLASEALSIDLVNALASVWAARKHAVCATTSPPESVCPDLDHAHIEALNWLEYMAGAKCFNEMRSSELAIGVPSRDDGEHDKLPP
jgi:hypothetical protein